MKDPIIEEIRKIEQRVTCGPWFYNRRRILQSYVDGARPYYWNLNIAKIPCRSPKYPISHEEWEANAHFIAKSREWIPYLLNQISYLEEQLHYLLRAREERDSGNTCSDGNSGLIGK